MANPEYLLTDSNKGDTFKRVLFPEVSGTDGFELSPDPNQHPTALSSPDVLFKIDPRYSLLIRSARSAGLDGGIRESTNPASLVMYKLGQNYG